MTYNDEGSTAGVTNVVHQVASMDYPGITLVRKSVSNKLLFILLSSLKGASAPWSTEKWWYSPHCQVHFQGRPCAPYSTYKLLTCSLQLVSVSFLTCSPHAWGKRSTAISEKKKRLLARPADNWPILITGWWIDASLLFMVILVQFVGGWCVCGKQIVILTF